MVKAENTKSLTSIKDLNDKATEASNYFWHTETDTGAGAGAHITEIPKEDFIEAVTEDPTSGGGNTLITSTGMAIRDGLTEVATFGTNKIELGKNSERAQIDVAKGSGVIKGSYAEGAENGLVLEAGMNGRGSLISRIELMSAEPNSGSFCGVGITGDEIILNKTYRQGYPSLDDFFNRRLEDWVVYQNSVDGWLVRWWASDIIEGWRKVTGTGQANVSSNGVYRTSAARSIATPVIDGVGLFSNPVSVRLTGGFNGLANSNVVLTGIEETASGGVNYNFYPITHSSMSGSRGYTAYFHVIEVQ